MIRILILCWGLIGAGAVHAATDGGGCRGALADASTTGSPTGIIALARRAAVDHLRLATDAPVDRVETRVRGSSNLGDRGVWLMIDIHYAVTDQPGVDKMAAYDVHVAADGTVTVHDDP